VGPLPQARFQDVGLPPLVLAAGNDTTGIDFTPAFFTPNKHYQIGWTTLYTGAIGTTGSIKCGLSQNPIPFVAPPINAESSQVFDCSTQLTAANAGGTIQSVCVVFLPDPAPFAPNISFFFEGTGLSGPVNVLIREAFCLQLD
jgi:hypothetical protein